MENRIRNSRKRTEKHDSTLQKFDSKGNLNNNNYNVEKMTSKTLVNYNNNYNYNVGKGQLYCCITATITLEKYIYNVGEPQL
jgi:hypothetical protein